MARDIALPSLAKEPWLQARQLREVMAALTAAGGEVRVAGGAVRNALLGVPVADVDLATTLLPVDVMRICKAAGLGVHPTGLLHGTITVVNSGVPFEVTTLRRDVATDGRRAVVSFTLDWAGDAARRDFTMNALYCDINGKIYDFTNGYEDLLKCRVRFVGKPTQRIKEDYLRILRFFRFHASFGGAQMDAEAVAACAKKRAGIRKLSVERVRQELLKILEAPQAVKALQVMAECNILRNIFPYTDDWRAFSRLPADGVLRLFFLAQWPLTLQETLHLSNAEAARVRQLADAPDVSPRLLPKEQHRILYQLGVPAFRDAVRLSWAKSRAKLDDPTWASLLALPERWAIPKFPVTGADLKSIGVVAGPAMGRLLTDLQDWWLASDFKPDKDHLLQHAGQLRSHDD
jgi:poly(A) polymerase